MTFLRSSMFFSFIGAALSVSNAHSQTVANVPLPPLQPSTQQTVAVSPGVPAEPARQLEGRLFFSPQERQRIDDASKRGGIPGDDGQIIDPPASVLNGFVKRGDGNTTVWVDGVPRWNATGKSADRLMPSDVGGPAVYLKATVGDAVVVAPKHTKRVKKVMKPRVKKITKLRRL